MFLISSTFFYLKYFLGEIWKKQKRKETQLLDKKNGKKQSMRIHYVWTLVRVALFHCCCKSRPINSFWWYCSSRSLTYIWSIFSFFFFLFFFFLFFFFLFFFFLFHFIVDPHIKTFPFVMWIFDFYFYFYFIFLTVVKLESVEMKNKILHISVRNF